MTKLNPRLLFLVMIVSWLCAALAVESMRNQDQRCFQNAQNFAACFGPFGNGHPR